MPTPGQLVDPDGRPVPVPQPTTGIGAAVPPAPSTPAATPHYPAEAHPASAIVGGAPLTQRFADEIGADGYGESAPAAVSLARKCIAAAAAG